MKSFKQFIVLLALLTIGFPVFGQSVVGKWYSLDPNNEKETIIELYQKEDKLYGKVVALLQEEDRKKTCKKCPNEFKDKPLLGLEILKDFTYENNLWTNGTILVPKTGKEYSCHISLDKDGALVIRGFVGFSLLGRSTYWYRVDG